VVRQLGQGVAGAVDLGQHGVERVHAEHARAGGVAAVLAGLVHKDLFVF
jgi:hypothetical protein